MGFTEILCALNFGFFLRSIWSRIVYARSTKDATSSTGGYLITLRKQWDISRPITMYLRNDIMI